MCVPFEKSNPTPERQTVAKLCGGDVQIQSAVESGDLTALKSRLEQIRNPKISKPGEVVEEVIIERRLAWSWCLQAASLGHSAIVRFLLEKDPSMRKSTAKYLEASLEYAMSKNYRKLAKFLIEAGASTEQDLIYASERHLHNRLSFLLQCGGNVRVKKPDQNLLTNSLTIDGNRLKNTSLSMLEIQNFHNQEADTIRLLLEYGVDLDTGAPTPLAYVDSHTSSSEGAALLQKFYIPHQLVVAAEDVFTIINEPDKNPDINKFKAIVAFLGRGLQGKMGGNTALHVAVHNNDKARVSLLLSAGANVDILNDQEQSPLHIALDKKDPYILCLCYIHHLRLKQDGTNQNKSFESKYNHEKEKTAGNNDGHEKHKIEGNNDEKERQEIKEISDTLNFILDLQKPVSQRTGLNMGQKDLKNSDVKDLKDIKESGDKAKTKKPEILITKEELKKLISTLPANEQAECNAKCLSLLGEPMLKQYENMVSSSSTVGNVTNQAAKSSIVTKATI